MELLLTSSQSSAATSTAEHCLVVTIKNRSSSSAASEVTFKVDGALLSSPKESSSSEVAVTIEVSANNNKEFSSVMKQLANFVTVFGTAFVRPRLLASSSSSASSTTPTASSSVLSADNVLPRCASSDGGGLQNQIGTGSWRALLNIFEEGAEERSCNASSSSSSSSSIQRAVLALSVAQAVPGLHPIFHETILWEISRRLRMCADENEVKAEIFGEPSNNNGSVAKPTEEELATCKAAVPQIFEEKKFVKSTLAAMDEDDDEEEEEEQEDDDARED